MNKVPVTIITGYLGSGKTTLLRNIASESQIKIAILMNEFGEIAIDSKVVKGKNIEMAELSGGCVCCSLSGEFEAAIGEILEKVKPSWIIVETTGVAEPSTLASSVVDNIEGVKLDAIITIVDLDSLVRFPKLGHTGIEQIEMADLLILNKKDLIDKGKLHEIKEKISSFWL
jgi:G3E family GTPase